MLDPAARRLIVASLLRLHVAERIGTDPIGADDAPDLARRLADPRAPGWTFDPPYPGATTGPEDVAGGTRVVLRCRASHAGDEIATVITTLIPGRRPAVTAAPPGAPIHR